MREAIENFSRQLAYIPEVVHREKLLPFSRVAVMGMGGSRWPAYLIRNEVSGFPITLHNAHRACAGDENQKESARCRDGDRERARQGTNEMKKYA